MALPWYVPVTASDLVRDSIATIEDDLTEAVEQALTDILGNVETFLQRQLIVRQHSDTIYRWRRRHWDDDTYDAYVRVWPAVEVVSATNQDDKDVTDYFSLPRTTAEDYGYRVYSTEPGRIDMTYWAGYRKREEDTLADVQAYTAEHSTLTTLPPVLPHDIRSVITELTLHRIALAKSEQFGTCLLYTSPSPRDRQKSRMPSSA